MNKIKKKTSIFLISCAVLWQNLVNTYFGHFVVENTDTGLKMSFCNYKPLFSAVPQWAQTKANATKYVHSKLTIIQ